MSEEKVEIVRSIYESWEKGDFGRPASRFDAQVVFVLNAGFPEEGVYFGRQQLIDYTTGLLAPWERFTVKALDLTDADGTIVADVQQRGVGKHSGVVTEMRYYHVWTLRGNKVIRLDAFRDRAAALEAAGLSE